MSEFKKLLSVTKTNLNDKLANHSALIYDVGLKIYKLEDALRRLEHKLDLKEAQIYRNMAIKYQALKTVTATRINSEVKCHPEIVELKEEKLDIQKALGLAKLKMKTLDTMTETVVNYSHNVRGEKKSSSLNRV